MISHSHEASWELPPDPPDYNAALPPTTNYDIPTFICRFQFPPALPFMIILLLLEITFDFVRPTYGAEADAELPPARDYDNCLSTLRTLRSTFAFLLMLMMPLIIPTYDDADFLRHTTLQDLPNKTFCSERMLDYNFSLVRLRRFSPALTHAHSYDCPTMAFPCWELQLRYEFTTSPLAHWILFLGRTSQIPLAR